jgi:hypothetical protein
MRRWGIFWRPLACRFDRHAKLISVCAKLHNFFVTRNSGSEHIPQNKIYTRVYKDGKWVKELLKIPDIANEVLNGEVADPDDRESSILRRRTVIAAALGRTGIDVTDMRAAIAARERILRSVESKGLRRRSQKKIN